MENQPSESNPSERHGPDTRIPDRKIRTWPIVRQSFAVLFRNVVPFVLLAGGVAWTVGMVLFLTGLAPFLVLRNPEFATLYYRQIASVTLHALSNVAVEAVIAMAVWRELSGRRLTLKGSLHTVSRAIPGILHRPFCLFVSRVSSVAILRAVLYLPHYMVVVLVLTSELDPASTATSLVALSFTGALLNTLIDSRLLILLPVAAIERTGVRHTIRRCWQLTSRHWTRIFGVILLVGCFSAVLNLPSSSLFRGVARYLWKHELRWLVAVVIVLVKGLDRACWAVVAVVCYRHIRIDNGEIVPEQAAVPPTA